MSNDLTSREFLNMLQRDGVIRDSAARLTPLAGGVSSEIYLVEDGTNTFVVKRALARLRVRDNWTADVSRSLHEQMFIDYVARLLPGSVPALLFPSQKRCEYFAMEFLGNQFDNWKHRLMQGEARAEDSIQAATVIGTIHAGSAGDPAARRMFDTTSNFMQLRIEPYLLTSGRKHPDLQLRFEAEAERLASSRECLVHGDFSPKNIMISPSRLVLLDCEVAWYGDPAFDIAFLLTHFLLKGLYHAPVQVDFHGMCRAFLLRYTRAIGESLNWSLIESRVAVLLPMLLLARVDGKSPVEYLTDARKISWVRQFARSRLLSETRTLSDLFNAWFGELNMWEVQ